MGGIGGGKRGHRRTEEYFLLPPLGAAAGPADRQTHGLQPRLHSPCFGLLVQRQRQGLYPDSPSLKRLAWSREGGSILRILACQ